ncbi:MAG: hypothetical protein HY290_32295 [Planctomycetia bacterium]|nr:hypothetical protein [Planctomycetia bacterium]
MATHDDFSQEPAPTAKKSSGSKVLLILGTIAGLFLVLCCGGAGFLYYKFKDTISVTTNAAEVKKQTSEIVTIDIPEGYTPISAVRFSPGIFTMKMMMYQGGTNNQGGLVLMEMNQAGSDPKQMRDQMLQQMRSQQAQGGGSFNSQIVAQSTETKVFKINGENVEFDFVKGTRAGDSTVMRQVVGTFSGKGGGTILFMLIVQDSDYDEEAVSKLIKSIRIPGSTVATEAPTESAAGEGMPEKDEEGEGDTEATPEKSE